jgi:hypothetical protein
MTKEELAQELNGREYRYEISREEAEVARENNLVVVFGYYDDLVEFRGAIDRAWCLEGVTVSIDKNGLLENQCEYEDCPYFADRTEKAAKIEAVWCPPDENLSWSYKTEIPHATFNVMEGGEIYCRGIVFSMGDVK